MVSSISNGFWSSDRRPRWVAPAAAAFVLVVLVLVALAASGDDQPATGPAAEAPVTDTASPGPGSSPMAAPSPSPSGPLVDSARFVNRRGGYRFSLPEDWKATRKGKTTNLRAPQRAAAVSIGPLSAPSLKKAARSLLGSIRAGYENVKVDGRENRRVGRARARAIGGSAVNERGARLRFLVIAVKDRKGFFGVNVFTPRSSDPAEVLPSVQTIVSSFEPLKRSS